MAFTRLPTPEGSGRVSFGREGAQVRIGPDPCAPDDYAEVTFVSALDPARRLSFGFNEHELADIIYELIAQHDRLTGSESICEECELERMMDPMLDDETPWWNRPLGKTERFMHGASTAEDDRLRNKMVVPFQVGELVEMIDGLNLEDVVEIQIPVGT